MEDLDPVYTTCFLGPNQVRNPNGISTGLTLAIFAQLTAVSSGMTFPVVLRYGLKSERR